MRVIIIGLLTLAILYYLIIYPIRNDRTKNWFMVIIIALILIPTSAFEIRYQILQSEGSSVVAKISNNPQGHLRCERLYETFFDATSNTGEVYWDNPTEATLKYTQCENLFAYITGDKTNPSLDKIIAVHVLTHESIHVSGDRVEATTECTAMQKDSQTAQLLGATKAEGDQLSLTYYIKVYPNMASNYVSAECHAGGKLDRNPQGSVFPYGIN